MTTLTLPIQAGKSYVRRDGRIVVAREVPEQYTPESVLINVAGEPSGSDQMAWKSTGRVRHLNKQDPLDLIADHIPIKGHVHAALMAEYAADAAECAEPWTRWERTLSIEGAAINDIGWCALTTHPGWDEGLQYRRRPKTIKLGDKEILAPLRVAPAVGTIVYFLGLEGVEAFQFLGGGTDNNRIDDGLYFATKDDAEAARLAILEMLKP